MFLSYTTRLAISVSLGGFLFGFDASVISGVVPLLNDQLHLSDWQLGALVSAPTFGGLISATLVSTLSDRFGRKPLLFTIALIYLFSAIGSALAPNFNLLVLARFIGGLGFGSLVLAPLYISEIAPPARRGALVSCNQFNIVIGFALAYFSNFALHSLSQYDASWVHTIGLAPHLWRWMLGLEILPATLYVLTLTALPESPRWLILQGQPNQAARICERLQIALPISGTQTRLPPLKQRLGNIVRGRSGKMLGIALIVAMAQQITGINAIYFYAPSIFEMSGLSRDAAFAQASIIGLVNIAFTVLAMLLIDRLGRKPLLLAGLSGVFLSMCLCAWEFRQAHYQMDPSLPDQYEAHVQTRLAPLAGRKFENRLAFQQAYAQVLTQAEQESGELYSTLFHLQSQVEAASIQLNATRVMAGLLLFVAAFALSLGPVMWVLLPELFSNSLRGVGMAITGLANSSVSFLVQFLFPWQISTLGIGPTFLIYGAFALLALIAIAYLLPETRGSDLESHESTSSELVTHPG